LIHRTLEDFWDAYESLPQEIQALADRNFQLLKSNSAHPSLHFKKVGDSWSVRVGRDYRALALEEDGVFYWYWVGKHSEYEKQI
jgi:hypothetical protein